jgi:predicted deacetylase
VFFRDDDAGWEDSRLMQLLDLFERYELPIDLAAIPRALTPSLSKELNCRIDSSEARVRVHQHGYAHLNHEREGRKCEFGPARDHAAQRADIAQGKSLLQDLMDSRVDPIFTPPWNRCTAETGKCLVELGFRALSRESDAVPLATPGLAEVPISQDWFAHRKGVRLSREEWGQSLASKLGGTCPVGIMFHHAMMDDEEMRAMGALLALLTAHPNARCVPMIELLRVG